MLVKIVVDSALNIPEALLHELGITVIPVCVAIDNRTYREGMDVSRSELVQLIASAKKTSTSQPAPGEFLAVYDQLQGDIISIHVTAKASGTCQTAQIAADMSKLATVRVLDSASASFGGGWLAIAAALASKRGLSLGEIEALVEEAKGESAMFLSVPTLKYLEKSGRVNFAKAVIASLLSVKPVMHFNEGIVEVISRARSMQGAVKEMVNLLVERYGHEPLAVAVMHAEDVELGLQLQEALRQTLNVGYEVLTDLAASLVVHGGPGSIAVAVLPLRFLKGLA
ncbi:MAG: DegV family protein [Bacillota bacterium]|nr:MAG: DegV family protein [Bacillota bacterium]MBS3950985.1 DegV family protein [Peptococcaceae bacterium]